MDERTGSNQTLILAAMVVAFLVALIWMPSGKVESEDEATAGG